MIDQGLDLGHNVYIYEIMPMLNRFLLTLAIFSTILFYFKKAAKGQIDDKQKWIEIIKVVFYIGIAFDTLFVITISAVGINSIKQYYQYFQDHQNRTNHEKLNDIYLTLWQSLCTSPIWLINSAIELVEVSVFFIFVKKLDLHM